MFHYQTAAQHILHQNCSNILTVTLTKITKNLTNSMHRCNHIVVQNVSVYVPCCEHWRIQYT